MLWRRYELKGLNVFVCTFKGKPVRVFEDFLEAHDWIETHEDPLNFGIGEFEIE